MWVVSVFRVGIFITASNDEVDDASVGSGLGGVDKDGFSSRSSADGGDEMSHPTS